MCNTTYWHHLLTSSYIKYDCQARSQRIFSFGGETIIDKELAAAAEAGRSVCVGHEFYSHRKITNQMHVPYKILAYGGSSLQVCDIKAISFL